MWLYAFRSTLDGLILDQFCLKIKKEADSASGMSYTCIYMIRITVKTKGYFNLDTVAVVNDFTMQI